MLKKSYILIIVYSILIISELFLFVPYEKIEIFLSNQKVPHTEVIGSGYTTIIEISNHSAITRSNTPNAIGKRVNTPQLLINLVVSTLVFAALYFIFFHIKNSNTKYEQLSLFNTAPVERPHLDINALAFADEQTINAALLRYEQEMEAFVHHKIMSDYLNTNI